MFTTSMSKDIKSAENEFSEDEKIIMDYYGKKPQEYWVIEKMCKLTEALIKVRGLRDTLYSNKPLSDAELAGFSTMELEEQIADVIIMINHLIMSFKNQDSVQNIIERKIFYFDSYLNNRGYFPPRQGNYSNP